MKFLVTQRLPEGGTVVRDHLEPLAAVIARSLEDPPRGPVIWLGGCGTVDTEPGEAQEFHMLFEAPDRGAIDEVVKDLPGLHRVERVMAADRRSVGRGLMLGLAKSYEERRAREAAAAS